MSQDNKCTVVLPGAGNAFWSMGDLVTFKIGPEQTGGRFSLAEMEVVPHGGPPPHIHRREEETFYVLEGELEFIFAHNIYRAKPGDAFFLPRGVPHTLHNPTGKIAKALVMASPCGFELFMMMFGRPKAECPTAPAVRPEDIDRLMMAAPKFGIEMLFDHKPTLAPIAANCTQKSLWVMGSRVDLHLLTKDTNGEFLLTTVHCEPGVGVPAHAHAEQDEMFYIREGTFEFLLGDRKQTVAPGTTIFVPRQTMHAFQNVGTTPGSFASYHFPAGFEEFFLELGVECCDPQQRPRENPDMARVISAIHKHGMTMPTHVQGGVVGSPTT